MAVRARHAPSVMQPRKGGCEEQGGSLTQETVLMGLFFVAFTDYSTKEVIITWL